MGILVNKNNIGGFCQFEITQGWILQLAHGRMKKKKKETIYSQL